VSERYYFAVSTVAGWVGILASPGGLRRTTLPSPAAGEVPRLLGIGRNQARWSPDLFQDLTGRLRGYFAGHRLSFPDRLDLSGATPFQRQVWAATRLIPYGETRSYKWIAEQIKKPGAWRAVGQALGQNPLPIIIPCHRVVASDGSLGGFSGGTAAKRSLLRLETAGR